MVAVGRPVQFQRHCRNMKMVQDRLDIMQLVQVQAKRIMAYAFPKHITKFRPHSALAHCAPHVLSFLGINVFVLS